MQRSRDGRYTRAILINGSVNTFPLLGSRFLIMQQLYYNNGRAVFSTWSVSRCYKLDEVWSLVESEFCVGVWEEMTRAREAEESPLLEAVAWERLMKIQQAEKGLACAVVT
jgi:hypothetical protein